MGEVPSKKEKLNIGKIILRIILSIIILTVLAACAFLIKHPEVSKALYNFTFAPTDQISSNNGKVNILLMGKSGANHDGADLTDTLILISVPLESEEIKTVSIPRDIWVPELMAKINSAYYWGKNGSAYFSLQDTGGGISFAKRIVGKIIGQPVQYGIVIDFSSFKDIVDAVGGISVDVERPFVDNFYPIEGREDDMCDGDMTFSCRYETVIFDSGVQVMDGATALKYVRSRHAEGEEGTDIAREARQQKVIGAIKNKIIEPKTYLSVKRISALLQIADEYIETDIDLATAAIIARKMLKNVNNVSPKTFPEDLIEVPPVSSIYDNLYVFIPKAGNGNWGEIQSWFSDSGGW